MRLRTALLFTAALSVTLSCKGPGRQSAQDDAGQTGMRYSTLLTLQDHNGYITAQITDPWDSTRMLHTYVLVPRNQDLPENLPSGTIVRTPVMHGIFYTSVHASLIFQLGAYSSIAGVCDSEYMLLPQLQEDLKNGKIADCGNSMTPDIEKFIDLQPDAILLSPFENSGSYGKLASLGIPIIECADYMETSPLGRAEWMRFYGLITGTEHAADSVFLQVESSYNALKNSVADCKFRPTVVTEKKSGSAWYIAGGNSTVGQMLADAGADYIFKDEKSSGSVPYNPETVFDRSHQADIWLIKYNQDTPLTLSELKQEWSANAHMKAFSGHGIYACNASNSGFYEETPFHPDLLLNDYVTIFHPETVADSTLHYYHRVEK